MPLICLTGEALRGHPRSFRTRGCLQDVEEVETDRLLDLNRGALCAFWPDLLDADIAAPPKVVQILLLGRDKLVPDCESRWLEVLGDGRPD